METDPQSVADAVLVGSRVMLSIAAGALVTAGVDVTMPQFRALTVLAVRGTQPLGVLAEELGVSPSSASRLCDRLQAKGLLARASGATRREVALQLTEKGRHAVEAVTRARRQEIARVVATIAPERREAMVQGLHDLAAAATEGGHQVPVVDVH